MKQARLGFSLVELLVVIGIISLLAGIAAPIAYKLREEGKRTQCTNNLRQLGNALMAYIDDNRGRLPQQTAFDNPKAWFNVLPGYLDMQPMNKMVPTPAPGRGQSIFVCPSEKVSFDDVQDGAAMYFSSYALNKYIADKGIRFANIKDPSFFAVFVETPNGRVATIDKDGMSTLVNAQNSFRHGNSANICFADGHVGSVTREDVMAEKSGIKWEEDDQDVK